MTDSHEPSYYEIALTNRQVLTVFVILLACVVSAFFAGVWLGHRDVGPTAPTEIAERQEPGQQEAVPEDEEGRPLRELRFFTEDSAAATPEETPTPAAAAASPDSTLLQDLDGSPPAKPSGDQKKLPSLLPPEFTAEPEVAEKEAPTPAATTPAPTPEVSTPAPAPTQAGELVIQVFFSSDQQKAESLVSQLSGGGFPAFLSPVEVGGKTMYRVRLGPYVERSTAETAADRVRREYKLDTWITQ